MRLINSLDKPHQAHEGYAQASGHRGENAREAEPQERNGVSAASAVLEHSVLRGEKNPEAADLFRFFLLREEASKVETARG